MVVTHNEKLSQIASKPGFVAALDQSGGSTPGALKAYGIPENAYSGEDEMFRLMHEMRVRIMTAPAFSGTRILAAILFEHTMDGLAEDIPVPAFLWERRGIVPFLKIDSGLAPESGGVSLMKPMPKLNDLLRRAVKRGIFGTKMRSVIHLPTRDGIEAVVAQQFEIASQVAARGLFPIIEPEVSIKSPDKAGAETILRDMITRGLDALPDDRSVVLKLTLPETPDFYASLSAHPRVTRIVALSGGYSRMEACQRLSQNYGMIASFSRALTEGLDHAMSDAAFDGALGASIDAIFEASTVKG